MVNAVMFHLFEKIGLQNFIPRMKFFALLISQLNTNKIENYVIIDPA